MSWAIVHTPKQGGLDWGFSLGVVQSSLREILGVRLWFKSLGWILAACPSEE